MKERAIGETMPRYSDMDALIHEYYKNPTYQNLCKAKNNAPAADVVEVVRCKDCRHCLNSNEKCNLIDTRLHFYETDKQWTGDSFCSWGERREK